MERPAHACHGSLGPGMNMKRARLVSVGMSSRMRARASKYSSL